MENNNQRIYLYTHSPEVERASQSGEAVISTGGFRRPDGTMMDMAKPLSFTLDELKEMFSNENRLLDNEEKVNRLSEALQISQAGIQEISRIGWLNNLAINQVYSMTYTGFQQTLAGLEKISAYMSEYFQYAYQRDLNEIKEKTVKYISFLVSDVEKLNLPKFDITNSHIDDHLNDIYAFLKILYDGLVNNTNTIDGFLACSIIRELIVPFSTAIRKYIVRFYYENLCYAGCSTKWFDLINMIASDERFQEKLQYYIHLKTEMPFQDKIRLGKKYRDGFASLPNTIIFDTEYAFYHSRDEYFTMYEPVQKLLVAPDEIPNDGIIFL